MFSNIFSFNLQQEKRNVEPIQDLSEDEALEKLIERLEVTDPLSKENEDKRQIAFMDVVTNKMLSENLNYGKASDDHAIYNQSETNFKENIKCIDNNLKEQISIFNFGLDRWFEHGETHPPYFPWRIAVILSKRREFVLEKRFLESYCIHFRGRAGNTDEKITARAIKKGAIQ